MQTPFIITPDNTELACTLFEPQRGLTLLSIGFQVPFALSTRTEGSPDTLKVRLADAQHIIGKKAVLDDGKPKKCQECHIVFPLDSALTMAGGSVSIGDWAADLDAHDPPQATRTETYRPSVQRYIAENSTWQARDPVFLRSAPTAHAPDLNGHLPAVRPRLFILVTTQDNATEFIELDTFIETVCLFPAAHLGIVLHRAVFRAPGPDDTSRLIAMMAALEPLHRVEQPLETYLAQCMATVGHQQMTDLNIHPQMSGPQPLSTDELANTPAQALPGLVARQRSELQALMATLGTDEQGLLEVLEGDEKTRHAARLLRENGGGITGFLETIEALLEDQEPSEENSPYAEPKTDLDMAPPVETSVAKTSTHPVRAPLHPPAIRPHTARSLVQQAQRTTKDCSGMNLTGANLAGLDLSGMNFQKALLDNANLAGARLTRTCLNEASLHNARLDGALLHESTLIGAVLTHACLEGAQLAACNLSQAVCKGARFNDANLDGCCLDQANLQSCHFERAHMADLSAVQAALEGANLDDADLTCSRLDGSQADSHTTLRRTRLDQASLHQATWSGCQMAFATLTGVQAEGADFSYAHLNGAVLTGAVLINVNFDHASLERANLNRCELNGASFKHSLLKHAWLRDVSLENTDLNGAVLNGVHLDTLRQS